MVWVTHTLSLSDGEDGCNSKAIVASFPGWEWPGDEAKTIASRFLGSQVKIACSSCGWLQYKINVKLY